jgi:hypothetical protein
MKIRRGLFGGALLFAAAGCTEAQTTNPADTVATEVVDDSTAGDAVASDATAQDATAQDTSSPTDAAEADTAGCKLLTVANAEGEKCDEPMQAICDPESPQDVALMCDQSVWKKMADLENEFPFGCFCDPGQDECSYAFAACAVPGFVGLDSADRVRKAQRRLRLV